MVGQPADHDSSPVYWKLIHSQTNFAAIALRAKGGTPLPLRPPRAEVSAQDEMGGRRTTTGLGHMKVTFRQENGTLMDEETGSHWHIVRGLATDGPLRGQGLQPVPSLTAFDWAWFDFYPDSHLYQPEEIP
jgi:hypothetical protein